MPVNDRHPAYLAAVAGWQRCGDAKRGGDAVKQGPYLSKPDGLSFTEWLNYKNRALYFNAYDRSVDGLRGAVMRKAPALQIPTPIESHLRDITLAGQPFGGFVTTVLEEVIGIGRYGVVIDYSEEAKRPYWVPYVAEDIVNWGDGFVVLRESVTERNPADRFARKTVEQYRELRLDAEGLVVSIWRLSRDGKWQIIDERVPTRRGERLTVLPFVFFNPSSIGSSIEKPPLLDLADVNLSHYRSSADLEHARHWVAMPTIFATGVPVGTKFAIGSSVALVAENENAKFGYLEFTGAGLNELRQALDQKASMMATLGARLLEAPQGQPETATAIQMRHAGEHATLATIAASVSLGLSRALRIHGWWFGATDQIDDVTINVALNTDFLNIRMSPEELKALMLAWQSGAIGYETLYQNLTRGEITRPGVTADQERALIAAREDVHQHNDETIQ
jgi:hypothetical protein